MTSTNGCQPCAKPAPPTRASWLPATPVPSAAGAGPAASRLSAQVRWWVCHRLHRPRLPVSGIPPPPRACDLISLCLSILIWEAGLRIAHTSLVLLADTKLIYSKCHLPCSFSHMQVLFPTVLLCASCPERRQSDSLKLDGHVCGDSDRLLCCCWG